MICYCKQKIGDGDRRIEFDLTVDWGQDDLRDKPEPKHYVFHSFACVAQWALDRSLTHDGVTVSEGEPAPAPGH